MGGIKYSLDEHSESHPGSIELYNNAIDIIPFIISTSVPTDIYISNYDDSVYSLDPVNLSDYFVTEKTYHFLNRDNPPAEDFKIHRITSKYLDTNNASIT